MGVTLAQIRRNGHNASVAPNLYYYHIIISNAQKKQKR